MPDDADDRSLAPRRTLSGPVLPPPPPELEEQNRKAEAEADAAREAQRRREAEKQAKAQAKVEAREAEARSREEAKQAKAAKAAQADEARRAAAAAPAAATPAAPLASPTPQSSSTGTTTMPVAAPVVGAGAAAAARPDTQKASRGKRPAPRRTRRAQLRLVQVDAWSVMKTSFLLSIALGIVLVVAVAIILSVLNAAGVWQSIDSIVQQAVGTDGGQTFDIQKYVGASRVLGFTMIVAVVDVILITAIATLGAFLYNLSAALLGGIEVTLAEDS